LVGVGGWVRNGDGFGVPDLRAVLCNSSIRRELAGLGNTDDGHFGPLSVVAIGLVNAILGIDVTIEIEAGDIVITAILQMVEDWMHDVSVTEEAGLDGVENSLQSTADVVSSTLVHFLLASLNTLNILTKDEHVLLSNLLCDLDICTIHGTNNEATVHDELHIRSTRCFSTSRRNMLRKLRSWNDDLSGRNVVVWQEDDLEKVANLVIVVDLVADGSDQLDDGLGIVVTWSSLATNSYDSWDELVSSLILWSVKNGKISVNDVQNVHELSLILMYSLNLNIIKSIKWYIKSSVFLDPSLELSLVLSLDLNELVLESLISGVWSKLLKVFERSDPLIDTSESVTEQVGELWVAAMNPSSWSDTIGLVLKLTLIEVIELFENSLLEKFRVECCDTVDGVGADDGKVSHSNFLWPSLLDQTHSFDLLVITWVLLLQLADVQVVDLVDEFQVSWE